MSRISYFTSIWVEKLRNIAMSLFGGERTSLFLKNSIEVPFPTTFETSILFDDYVLLVNDAFKAFRLNMKMWT